MTKDLIKKLSDKDKDTLKAVGAKQTAKMLRNATKLFSKLCRQCRTKVFNNPKTRLNEYCENCQNKAKKMGF